MYARVAVGSRGGLGRFGVCGVRTYVRTYVRACVRKGNTIIRRLRRRTEVSQHCEGVRVGKIDGVCKRTGGRESCFCRDVPSCRTTCAAYARSGAR